MGEHIKQLVNMPYNGTVTAQSVLLHLALLPRRKLDMRSSERRMLLTLLLLCSRIDSLSAEVVPRS
jgi:hypothetical protein